jgi:hypothetical protein
LRTLAGFVSGFGSSKQHFDARSLPLGQWWRGGDQRADAVLLVLRGSFNRGVALATMPRR